MCFPAFNEGHSAAALVQRIDTCCRQSGIPYHIVAVDDGSTDCSLAEMQRVASDLPFTALVHTQNKGLRAALYTGLSWLADHADDNDIIVIMDGDDSHDPSCILPMGNLLNAGADVVIASRYRRGAVIEGVPRYRQWLSIGAIVIGLLLFRLRGVRDYTCGYRAVRARIVKSLIRKHGPALFLLDGYGFICAVELLLRFSEETDQIAEVPIVLHYERKETPSKMQTLPMILGFFALWKARREASG